MDILIGLKYTLRDGEKYSRCNQFVFYIRSAILYFTDLEKNFIEYFEDKEGKYGLRTCPLHMNEIDWLDRKSCWQKLIIKKLKIIKEQKKCLLDCISVYNKSMQDKKSCYESFLPLINLLEFIKKNWIENKENNQKEELPYAIQMWEEHFSNIFEWSFERQKKIQKKIGNKKEIQEIPSGFWQWKFLGKNKQSSYFAMALKGK